MNKKEKKHITIETEGLAIPEIHTGFVEDDPSEDEVDSKEDSIAYENLAIPEVHIKKKA